MLRLNSKKRIVIVEKGKAVERRACPKGKPGQCVNCKPYCHITTGYSGAGAVSDGKLSLSGEVGGDLPMLIGADAVQEAIDYVDRIHPEVGADEKAEGTGYSDACRRSIPWCRALPPRKRCRTRPN